MEKYDTNHTGQKEDIMKNTGKTILTLFAGMLFGAALFSGGVAHAAEIFYKSLFKIF